MSNKVAADAARLLAHEIVSETLRPLGRDTLFALLYIVDEAGSSASLLATSGPDGLPAPPHVPLTAGAGIWHPRPGSDPDVFEIDDLGKAFRTGPTEAPVRGLVAHVRRTGDEDLVALLVVGIGADLEPAKARLHERLRLAAENLVLRLELARARTEIARTEQRVHDLIRHAPAGIYEVDFRTLRFTAVNDIMCEMLGYTRDELLATNPFDVLDEPDRDRFRSRIAAWLAGEAPSRDVEYRVRRRDGRLVDVVLSSTFTADELGRPLGATVVGHDITERKRAEEALRASRDELELLARTLEETVADRTAEAVRRASQLRVLHAELSRAEQRERRRLATLLHDGLQQLLVAARLRMRLARSQTGTDPASLLAEVDGLLEKSLAVARDLTIELSPPLLHDRGLVAALRWLASEMECTHRLTVDVRAEEGAEPVAEDVRLLLFQAARELLFNVAKHAGVAQARVTLERHEFRLVLEVADAGCGFDPARWHARDEGSLPTFGLLSVEQRVDWLGGGMAIDSAPGSGTRVRLSVPLTTIAPPSAWSAEMPGALPVGGQGPAETAPARPKRVLLADDHKIVREGLAALLADYGDLEVVGEAADGEEAVSLTRHYRPDVVVMDLAMPKLDGIEATRRISSEMPGVRVIGLSMHDSEEVADAMRAAGAVGYVRKGGPIDDLITLIRREEA